MKKSIDKFSLICGLLLTLAAFPVFAQSSKAELNKRPLQDFGQIFSEKVKNKEVDLKTPFSLTLQGTLDANGKFDPKMTKVTKSEGDAKIIELAKLGIEAVSDSGVFYYLKQLKVDEVEISLVQTDLEFSADFKSTFETAKRAKSIGDGIKLNIQIGKSAVKDENTKAILENSKVETIGKDFLLRFSMPFEQFHGIIDRELEKVKK
ncbi:MAG: hypothetical protein LUM44_18970 [Pyrinomonadaceae bacterium]|nr:hypothetical protein [Pyrinomonadaceae bacterium]